MLLDESASNDVLAPDFKVPRKPNKFFKLGKVFMTLWSEPAGEPNMGTDLVITSGVTSGMFGERIFSKVRRFVIVREGATYSIAAQIMTYGRRGVAKAAVVKSEHAIVHSGKIPPTALADEEPKRGELGMLPGAIRVDLDTHGDKLDPMSRVNFGRLYTIEHNLKVRSIGIVNRDCIGDLVRGFTKTLESSLARTADVNTYLRAAKATPAIHGDLESENRDSKLLERGISPRVEHTDIQASAAEVASFFGKKGFMREADDVERAMAALVSKTKRQDQEHEEEGSIEVEQTNEDKQDQLQPQYSECVVSTQDR